MSDKYDDIINRHVLSPSIPVCPEQIELPSSLPLLP